ncbi:MAG TPA: DUF1365 domain-containing protein [Drouetiella sp.]|jgi:uncharacterized protein
MKNLTSCLYESKITHQRMHPKKHRVEHSMFLFYLDLDELGDTASRLLAYNKFSLYALFDRDHFDRSETSLKRKVIDFIHRFQPGLNIDRIKVLTNLRFLNYVFNPITVFYCFDNSLQLQCAVAEVGNTFGEKKPYLILSHGTNLLKDRQRKNFYVSPFINLDTDVAFELSLPGEKLNLNVNTIENGETVLAANTHGRKIELTDSNLLALTFKYPFVTFFVIGAIHFHALLLWLKKVPFITKEANSHLQTGILRPYASPGDRK